jgi:diaminohydroxyphosphoribosylaminopyrimidine deaminase/5-amino-6-(5-phosphoribosylamino)uracil reductase
MVVENSYYPFIPLFLTINNYYITQNLLFKEIIDMRNDIYFMKEALKEAEKGFGNVSPNPYVGAIIVKDGEIVGRGAHLKYGENHAEVNAIENCSVSCKGATIYVTLEPCNHFGNTPPCSVRIVEEGFKRVVIGVKDYNPKVEGSGIDLLRKHGIEVEVGVLESECFELNRHFFHTIRTKLPYLLMKSAITLDGAISTSTGSSKWISGKESRGLVHKYRLIYDGVMVGRRTVIADNPSLTVRDSEGDICGRTPYRIVIDDRLDLDLDLNLFSDQFTHKTIIVTSDEVDIDSVKLYEDRGIKVVKLPLRSGLLDPQEILKALYKLGIYSILLEGGSYLSTIFLKSGNVSRVNLFIAPKLVGNGNPFIGDLGISEMSNAIEFEDIEYKMIGRDILFMGTPRVG